jgi:hypothetical protein
MTVRELNIIKVMTFRQIENQSSLIVSIDKINFIHSLIMAYKCNRIFILMKTLVKVKLLKDCNKKWFNNKIIRMTKI